MKISQTTPQQFQNHKIKFTFVFAVNPHFLVQLLSKLFVS